MGLIPQDAWEGQVICAFPGDTEHWTQHQGVPWGQAPFPPHRWGKETREMEYPTHRDEQSWAPDTVSMDWQREQALTSSQPSFCNKCPWRLIKKESHTLSFTWKTIATIYPHLFHMWWKGKRCIEMSWRREVIENKIFLHLFVYSSHIYGPPTMCQALGQVPKTLYWPQTHLVCALLQHMIQGSKHQQVK